MTTSTLSQERQMTVVDWLITLFIVSVPFIGFIFTIVWATGRGGATVSKQNFARAMIVWYIIAILFSLFLGLGTFSLGEFFLQDSSLQ